MEHRAERVFSGIPQFVSERSVCVEKSRSDMIAKVRDVLGCNKGMPESLERRMLVE